MRPHVIILGCGFGGLFAARALRGAPLDVTVVDRVNHHLFQPLLYQVATAGLSAPAIAAPIRHILAGQENVTVLLAEVQRVAAARRAVVLEDGSELVYDYLIVATGVTHSYFGNDAWAEHAPGLKTLDDAMEIRRRILLAYEHAERESDPARRAPWLTSVVIGAGATGVELAGMMAEIARHTLRGEFRRFDPSNARIVLVEGAERVLPSYPADLSQKARLQLERLGVTVWLGRRVTSIDAGGVQLGDDRIAAKTLVWAAGVKASALGASLGAPLDGAGRVLVQPDLSVAGQAEVFVIGDLASVSCHRPPVPGVAPAAKQMGRLAAKNILRRIAGEDTLAFRYRDYGMLATIGRNSAVGILGRVRLSGYLAWLTWLLAHIYFLINFRNRLVVMIDWAWSYWTFQRFARVVFGAVRPPDRP
ncbi:MAG: NAD(P)/FAD-dependent oxidoreductase [Giesbergeria sp.]